MKHFFSIIGGMGTIATESYVRLINHRVKIARDQDYLNYILVNDAQVPDRTAYIKDHSKPNFFYDLKDDVEGQDKLGTDFWLCHVILRTISMMIWLHLPISHFCI